MRGMLKRNATVSQLLQTHHHHGNNKKITGVFTGPVARIHSNHLKNQTQSRDFKLTDFLRKTTRAYNEVSPYYYSLFSFPFSKSSAKTVSFSEVGFVGWYLGMVKSRPVLTKSVTCSLIFIAADLSSQTLASSEPYELVRTLRMAGYGMLILGPTLHFWFNFVSKLFPKQDLSATLKKMAIGQTIYGPIMTVMFLSVNASLQGESGEEIVARLKRDLLPTMFRGVMYWPMCDFITFRFIPVHLQGNLGFHLTIYLFGIPLTAIGEQFIFISMDYLSDIYGKPRKSCHNLKLIDSVFIFTSVHKFKLIDSVFHASYVPSTRFTLDKCSSQLVVACSTNASLGLALRYLSESWLMKNCYELDP